MMRTARLAIYAFVLAVVCAAASAQVSPTYTPAQATAGKATYDQKCAACHGAALDNGEFAPPVRGDDFWLRWGGKGVEELFNYLADTMPTTDPGSLTPEEYLDVLAYVLSNNSVAAGSEKLTLASQRMMTLPNSAASMSTLATGVKLPPNPRPRPNPLSTIRPVTVQMLNSPPDGSWLGWRRTPDAQGFSPLKQINKQNVARLQLAWSLVLPPGPNQATPLMHDGVLFVHSFKDIVQAIDAATGDVLWQYTYRLPKGANPSTKKSLAILGDLLFVPTSDAHIVALNVKTGAVAWDTNIAPGYSIIGGPIVANKNIVVGTTRGPKPSIVALDSKTGKEVWRFDTIPRPGEPGGDTWNGVAWEKRSGGSVWTSGSYDPVTNLVFFGPSPTYDTRPLRDRIPGGNNDALYTDATLALNADTGKLAWYFQHLPNDQWDLDWSFERQIITLGKGKNAQRAVVTAGKLGIHDAVDAATGRYLFSIDLGFQNLVKAIDPVTGAKTIDTSLVPGDGTTKFICPNTSGGKNFPPSGYDPNLQTLFIPYAEACMDVVPVRPGENGFLSTGVNHGVRPAPNSDGLYGRLQAINLATRKTIWTVRERAPFMTGTLPTAGGLVFAGAADRMFSAYDDATGKKLWTTRLNDVPNSNPISYEVNGKQYIAIVTGGGGFFASDFSNLTPEIKSPSIRTSSVFVFEVR